MLISTRGKYAIRVMADIAEHGFVDQDTCMPQPLKEIADRQDISLKYLESIMSLLAKNKLVASASGPGGGYKLLKRPDEYTLGEILRVTEGELEPVSCMSQKSEPCERSSLCNSFPIWRELSTVINDFLDSKTLYDVMKEDNKILNEAAV